MWHLLRAAPSCLALLVALAPTPVVAMPALPPTIENITPQNASNFGISVHIVWYDITCPGRQVWIEAPREAESAHLQYAPDPSNPLFVAINVQPQFVTLSPEEELKPTAPNPNERGTIAARAFENRRKQLGFLANGFRGVTFCLKVDVIPHIRFQFRSWSTVWDFGYLGQWYSESQ